MSNDKEFVGGRFPEDKFRELLTIFSAGVKRLGDAANKTLTVSAMQDKSVSCIWVSMKGTNQQLFVRHHDDFDLFTIAPAAAMEWLARAT